MEECKKDKRVCSTTLQFSDICNMCSNYLILNMCAVCACTCMCVRTIVSFCVYVCLYMYVSLCVYVNFGVGVFQSAVGACVRRKLLGTETHGGLFIFPLSAGQDKKKAANKECQTYGR